MRVIYISVLHDHVLLCRLNPITVKPDLLCSPSNNCWFCQQFCLCCSKYLLNPENGSKFCCDECDAMFKLDPSATPTVVFNHTDLEVMFASKNPPLIAFMQKVFSTDSDGNTILRIYLSRSDNSVEGIPPGTLFAICQIKTASTQSVIDCLLSKDYVPLEPVWYSDFCDRMINKYRALLHREIIHLVTQTLVASPWHWIIPFSTFDLNYTHVELDTVSCVCTSYYAKVMLEYQGLLLFGGSFHESADWTDTSEPNNLLYSPFYSL